MTALFFALHRNHKKIIFSRSKIRNKNPGHGFFDFILFFYVTVEKFGKKIIWSSWSSRKDFSKPRISGFRVQILEIR